MYSKKYMIEEFETNNEIIGDKVFFNEHLKYAKILKTKIETQYDIDLIIEFLNHVKKDILEE